MGLSALYIFLKGEPFEKVLKEVEAEREDSHSPDFWEIVDEGHHSLDRGAIKLLQDLVSKGYSFTVHCPYFGINISDLDNERRRSSIMRTRRSIEAAGAIEARALILHPGKKARGSDQMVSQRLNEESILALYDYAGALGVPLAVENTIPNTPYFMSEPMEFEEFFERTRSKLKMVLDLGHAHLNGKIEAFISRLSDRLQVVHCHDNKGGKDEHLKIGRGTIDWHKITSELLKVDFRGLYVVESVEEPMESVALLRSLLPRFGS